MSATKPTLTPQEFSAKWASSKLKERANIQKPFRRRFAIVGFDEPALLDPLPRRWVLANQ